MKKNNKRWVLKKFTALILIIALALVGGCGKKDAAGTEANVTNAAATADNQTSERATEAETLAAKQPEVHVPDVTVIFYGAGESDLQGDLTDSVFRAMLGLYQTSGINYVTVLGGSDHWPIEYLAGLLDTKDDEAVNRTGWFCVNVDAVNEKLDAVAKEFSMDPLEAREKVAYGEADDLREKLRTRLVQEMFSESVLPQIEGTEITVNYPIQEERTLERTMKIITNQFQADKYFMIMGGHGGGSRGGVCYAQKSEEGKESGLTIPALDEAFSKAGFGNDLKLDLLAFDACSMGGIELGARLSKYFDFMIGSQVTQVGGLDQGFLITSIEDNRTDENLAYNVSRNVCYKKYSTEIMSIQTEALFYGPDGQNALDAMDAAAVELLNAARQGGTAEVEIYDAIKKAMMLCSNNGGYPDGLEFFTNLLDVFHEKENTQFDEVIEKTISAINGFLLENWYSLDGLLLYSSKDGGIIKENAEFEEKYMDHILGGGSICVIDFTNYLEAYVANNIEEFNQSVSDIMKSFDQDYVDRYKDCGLGNYAALMKQCADYYLREDKYAENKKLAADLADPAGADYKEITNVHWSDDKKAVQVEILDYKGEAAEASSGDVLKDFLDTAASYRLYLTRRLPARTKSNGKEIELDYIIGSKEGSRQSMESAHREINFLVSEWMDVKVYCVTSPSAQPDTPIDIVTQSNVFDGDIWYKIEVLKTALSVNEEEAGKAADQYRVYEGRCRTNGEVSDQRALHVFRKDGDDYRYVNTVLETSDEYYGEYSLVTDPEAISFTHYYMEDVIDGESGRDTGADAYKRLEEDYASVYDSDQYWYPSDALNQLSILMYYTSDIDKDAQMYGYYVGVVPTSAGSSMMLLNKNDAAVQGNHYAELPVY